MMAKYIIILLFLTAYQGLQAQTFQRGEIYGKITDTENKSIALASIILRNSADSSVYKTTISNKEGAFSLAELKTGNYLVEIKQIGFETFFRKNLTISEISPVIDLEILKLAKSTIMLTAVTIKAKTPFIESRADKIIVNMDNDIVGQGSAVMEVMDILPGVRVSPDEQISLEGKSVTIYIDGKATLLSGEALKGLLKSMPSSSIERIELIANPSSKYDAAGNGGIINIVRKKNAKAGMIGNIYGGIQQWNNERNNAGLILNFKGKGYNLFFNADYAYNRYFMDADLISDVFNPDSSLKMRSLSGIRSVRNSRSVVPSMGVDFYLNKKTTISLTGTESLQSFYKKGSTDMEVLNSSFIRSGTYNLLNNVSTRSSNYSSNVHLLYQIDSTGKELTMDLDYANYRSQSDQDNADTKNDASGNFISEANSLLAQETNWDIFAVKADFTRRFKDGNLETGLKSGYVASKNENDFFDVTGGIPTANPSFADRFNYSENINSGYFNLNKKYNKFSFQSGIRAEHTLGRGNQLQTGEKFINNYFHLFPSLALAYKLNSRHSINFHANKRINRPNYENLNPLIRIVNSVNYTGGNPELKPVISYNSSIGYSYKDLFFATLSYSRNLHDNISLTVPFNGDGVSIRKPGNNKYTEYFNLSMTWSKKITSWYTASSNISLFKQAFKSNADNYSLSSRGIPSANFNTYQSFTANKKLSFQVLVRYQGKYEDMSRITKANCYVVAGFRRTIFGTRGAISVNMSDVFNSYSARYTDTSPLIRQTWDNKYDVRLIRPNFTYTFGKGKVKKANSGDGAADEKTRTAIKEN